MTNSPSFKRIVGRALMVSAAALIGFASTAQAGFEWRGPLEPPAKPMAAPAPADQGMTGLAPVTTWDGKQSADVQWGQDNTAMPAEEMPLQTPPSPALAPFVAETPLAEPVEAGDVIAGFGTNLPLVIALQQVVPPGYQYAFAEGVNLGTPVSWEGGKGWRAVLSDMLASEGLGYRVRDNVVVVGYYPPEETLPQENMMSAPVSAEAAVEDAPAVEWHESEPAAAPVAAAGEPVTIRRQKPAALADGRTEGSIAQVDMDTSGSAAHTWQAPNDRTAGQSNAMSYPPQKTSSAPVAVTSAPPAAQNQVSAPEAAQPLSAPPPMDMGTMSAEPPSDAPVDIVASEPVEETSAAPVAAAEQTPPAQRAPAVTAGNWNGSKGATLRDTLKSWSDSAGVELYWSIDYDYRLKKDIGLDGSYDQAVAELLDQFSDVRPQPYGQLHQGDGGPRVLVVRSYDLTP